MNHEKTVERVTHLRAKVENLESSFRLACEHPECGPTSHYYWLLQDARQELANEREYLWTNYRSMI